MAKWDIGAVVIDHAAMRQAARDMVCEDLRKRIEHAEKDLRDHKRDDATTRAELTGYLRGLRDAEWAVRNFKD